MTDNPSRLVRDHPELFHYTTLAGLRGMVQNQTLWATHYQYLNDPTEIEHLRKELKVQLFPSMLEVAKELHKRGYKVRRDMKKHGGVSAVAKKETATLVDSFYGVTFEGEGSVGEPFAAPYITSFCSHRADSPYERENGLLSQWRAYGGRGGYAVVFDTKRFLDLLNKEAEVHIYSAWLLGEVIYAGDQERFASEFQAVLELFVQSHSDMINDIRTTDFGKMFFEFVKAAARYKHRAFQEEREVRLILCPMSEKLAESSRRKDPEGLLKGRTVKEIKHRKANGQRVPYIEAFAFGRNPHLPIKRIIVGPHSDQTLLERKAKKIIGRRKIKVQCSETPFRGQG